MLSMRVLAIFLLGSLASCAEPDWRAVWEKKVAQYRQTVANVDPQRGISREEAEAIAQLYHLKFVVIEGGVAPPLDRGAYWESPILVGFVGAPSGSIVVDKASGRVSSTCSTCYPYKSGPTLESPKELASE